MVVSNVFKFHPYLGKWSDLTNVFQRGWNHQLDIGLFLHNPNKSINPQNLMQRYSPGKTVVRWLHGHHHHCHVRLHCWVERLAGKLFGIKWAMKENTPGCWGYLLGMKSYQDHMGIIWNKPWNKDPQQKQPGWLMESKALEVGPPGCFPRDSESERVWESCERGRLVACLSVLNTTCLYQRYQWQKLTTYSTKNIKKWFIVHYTAVFSCRQNKPCQMSFIKEHMEHIQLSLSLYIFSVPFLHEKTSVVYISGKYTSTLWNAVCLWFPSCKNPHFNITSTLKKVR